MNNDANTIVQNWLTMQKQASQPTPADTIVNRWLAKQQGGEPHPLDDAALQNAQSDLGDQKYNGLCERFAEQQAYGKVDLFPTAADAWNTYRQEGKAQSDIASAPAGALIYFSPDQSNNGDGHVGIADGNGNFVSATANGVQQLPITDWMAQTGQQPVGYVLP